MPVVNRAAFRTFVLGFLDHAEVLEPPELRADIVALARRADRRERAPVSPRPLAGPRLQRILALVPWIVAHPGVTADRDRGAVRHLRAGARRDLELVLMIGVPPYTAGRLPRRATTTAT